MNVNSLNATNAYSRLQKVGTEDDSSTTGSTGSTSGSSFADMVGQGLETSMNQLRGSERTSAEAVLGKASLTDVVTAVNTAEVALKSVVAIRDKVINAYNDIMKMPV